MQPPAIGRAAAQRTKPGSQLWGNGEGIYSYKAYADRILDAMVHRKPITGPVRQTGAFGITRWARK